MRRIAFVVWMMIAFNAGFAQQRVFNYPLKLKSCHVTIEVNQFIASTWIELEFYNPTAAEVEGYQRLNFSENQVVSGFQLDLDGKYREGSIEERWKATNTYNTIVGKRVDPALLQMYSRTDYGLNIYPVPAKGSRKVKIFLQELVKEDSNRIRYTLPMNFRDTTTSFSVQVKVMQSSQAPYTNAGLLEESAFSQTDLGYGLYTQSTGIVLNKPIDFYLPLSESNTRLCLSTENGVSRFLLRTSPVVPAINEKQVQSLTVFWDVSRSARGRDRVKELEYLRRYIALHQVGKTEIVLFNQKLRQKIIYNSATGSFDATRKYLLEYDCDGGTELANLNFASVKSDMILLFSDGASVFGKALPVPGNVQVNSIVSGNMFNERMLDQITSSSGGRIINLNQYTDPAKSLVREYAINYLLEVRSGNKTVMINELLPLRYNKVIGLSGIAPEQDTIELVYGNSSTGKYVQRIPVSLAVGQCNNYLSNKVRMLKSYDSIMSYNNYRNYYRWYDQLAFGIREKVLTYQTAFLVLERIEDYIKFNIEPPAELEEACRQRNYVYKSDYRIKALEEYKKTNDLQRVVNNYNQRIRRWDKNAPLVDLNKPLEIPATGAGESMTYTTPKGEMKQSFMLPLQPGGGELKEVVVTGAFNTKRTARQTSFNVQVVSQAQLDVIRQVDLNNALAGKVAGLQVRSQSAAMLGAETIVRLRGENGLGIGRSAPLYVVNGTVVPDSRDINIDDIQDVTVLQGPAAAALFGSEGANGAIVVNYKRAKRLYGNMWVSYNLESVEDEDYLQQVQQAELMDVYNIFRELEKTHSNSPCFYFDMARHFHERGMHREAMEVLETAAEISSYNSKGLRAIAYILEEWKMFDKAIAIYRQLIAGEYYSAMVNRELALALFRNKQYQEAIDVLNEVIKRPDQDGEDNTLQKEQALSEMNAFIVASPITPDLSDIDLRLVKTMPADLRITVGGNESIYFYNNIRLTEPDGTRCSSVNPDSRNGNHFTSDGFSERLYYNSYPSACAEYVAHKAEKGKYKININAYDWHNTPDRIPSYVRVVVFKKFHSSGLSVEVKNIQVDNQYGDVCIAKISW